MNGSSCQNTAWIGLSEYQRTLPTKLHNTFRLALSQRVVRVARANGIVAQLNTREVWVSTPLQSLGKRRVVSIHNTFPTEIWNAAMESLRNHVWHPESRLSQTLGEP